MTFEKLKEVQEIRIPMHEAWCLEDHVRLFAHLSPY